MDGEGWDTQEMLLCCSNGIIDLTIGDGRSGKQSDYIKTVAPTRWLGIEDIEDDYIPGIETGGRLGSEGTVICPPH